MSVNDYIISSSDSTKTIRVSSEGITDNALSIPLVGYFWDGYGEFIAQAQLHTLENFQNSQSPANPIVGQLWYDSNDDKLKVYQSDNTWSIVGEAPEISLNDLDDVSISLLQEGNFLRYDQGVWKNQTYQSRFTDLDDTPPNRRPNAYIRSNASQTALVYFDKFNASTDFSGPITFEQLSRGDTLQQLCQWIKDNECIPTPLPAPFLVASHQGGACTTNVGTSCTATGSLTAEIINPESTTPPYIYTWTKASGETLDGGAVIQVVGVSDTKRAIATELTATASNVGQNTFISRYKVTVTDANDQEVTTLESVSSATYVIKGVALAPAPITNAIHSAGTCTSPPDTACTVTGQASINFNQTGTNSTGPYTYRWVVNDGSGSILVPEGGGNPTTSVIATSPFVQTSITRSVPASVNASFGVTVRGTVGGQPNTIIASAQVPVATYTFLQGDPLPQDYTLRVFINGSELTLQNAASNGFRAFFEDFGLLFPTGGVQVTEGTSTYITIVRPLGEEDWNLVDVSGCDTSASLDEAGQNTWTYSFVMPSNDCIVNITTEQQILNYTLTTSVPSGFSISPSYASGASLAAGTELQFTINRTPASARQFDGVSGCGGTLDSGNQSAFTGPWIYDVVMPESDCDVVVNTSLIPTFQTSFDSTILQYTNTPANLPVCPGSPIASLTTNNITLSISGGVPPYSVVGNTSGLTISNLSGTITAISGDPATSNPDPVYTLGFEIANDCIPASATGIAIITVTDSEGRQDSTNIGVNITYQQAASTPPPPVGDPPPDTIIVD